MKWPWTKQIDAARAEAKSAMEGRAHSEKRRINTEGISKEALEVTKVQWDELRRNGWTELLQQAWGGKQ